MQRRDFIKQMGLGAMGIAAGQLFRGIPMAHAAPTGFNPAQVQFNSVSAAQLPRYINIFLYGGPSELGGNLTNIVDINNNSQNSYGSVVSDVTANGFWGNAGGNIMESLITSGDMSIYRTMNRIKDDNKGHGASVTQNLLGSLNTQNPGIGRTMAWILQNNNPFGKAVTDLLFPIVSFEGESLAFNTGGLTINTALRPVSLNANLNNPYQRTSSGAAPNGSARDISLEDLAAYTNGIADLPSLTDSFGKRGTFAAELEANLTTTAINTSLTNLGLATTHYSNGNFGQRLRAAVSLSLANPETVFISLGSGGLGGWDDHSQAISSYSTRMQELMTAINAAMIHINAAAGAGVSHANNIIINVYGDFGRNVNLNNSMGWDHGNNQNLYTFGGKGIAGRGLGKVVGRTQRIGTPGVNRQFTSPTATSYQFEPFALASTMYKSFGVTNPQLITGEAPINETATQEN